MNRSRKGRFAYEGLDRVLHERARLGILSCIANVGSAISFADLKDLCDLTDGNLSRHLHALEQADIVRLLKENRQGRSQTLVEFTDFGRRRYLDYLEVLESIVRDCAEARRPGAPVADRWVPGQSPASP